jgi:hypothetical protein
MSWFKPQPNPNPWSGQKWEYTYIKAEDAYAPKLNELGQQGWELVAATVTYAADSHGWLYFKRPII